MGAIEVAYEIRENAEIYIANCWSEDMDVSHGLSIYFPASQVNQYNAYYHAPEFGLDFAQDSHWDELLMRYFYITGGRIEKMFLELEAELVLKDNF